MKIRRVDPGDTAELKAVGELTIATYVDSGLVDRDSDYVEELRDTAGRAKTAELLAAIDERAAGGSGVDADPLAAKGHSPRHVVDGTDERLLGTVTYCAGGTDMAEIAGPGEATFRMLAVDETARGRGIGEALVRACVERAREAGAVTVRLSTKVEMRAAHRLYERLGFMRTPQFDWSPAPDVPLLTYALDLS